MKKWMKKWIRKQASKQMKKWRRRLMQGWIILYKDESRR
jgi:hypothetical protein